MPLDFPDPAQSTTYTDPTSGSTYIYANGSWSLSSVLSATRGGTGFASYNRGDILYGNASGTLSKLSAGTTGQVLSTNGSGADPSWIAMSGGAQTIASSVNGAIAFYSGAGTSLKGRSGFTVNDSNGTVAIDMSDTSYAFHIRGSGNVSKFRFDTDNSILHLSAGTGKSSELRLYTGDGTYYTGFKPNATADKTYILPSTTPASAAVLQSDANGVMSWVTMSSGGGAGTVATPGSLGKIAYYASTGASVKDATGLDYSTSANILTVTSQNTSDVVLQLKGLSSSQTGSALVYKKDGSSDSFVVDKDGFITTGQWRGTVVSTTYGGTGQTTYTDGQLLIGNSNTSSLSKSTLSAGVGITITNGNGSITINNSRPVILNLASGFTPVGIGTDYNILRVPEGKNNTNVSYNIRKVVMGVGTTSSGTSTIRLEKSSGPHTNYLGFSLSSSASTWNAMSIDLSLLTGFGETSWTTFNAGYGTVATGDRVRLNFTAVDSTHANFIVQVLLEEN